MKRTLICSLGLVFLFASCVSKKKYAAIQLSNATLLDKMSNVQRDLDNCNREKAACEAKSTNLQTSVDHLKEQVNEMSVTNQALLNNVGNMATLSTQEAGNLEKSLENIREKDL